MKSLFSEVEKNQMVDLAKSGLSLTQIVTQLNLKQYRGNVYEIIKQRGVIAHRPKRQKYSFDDTIFDNIDTDLKAYWLGFLLGDGSITENSLTVELSNKDIDHLYKFRTFMNATSTIRSTRKECSVINLNNRTFLPKLAKYGLIRHKTQTVITPDIGSQYLKSFYHGILDSDGWIISHKHRKGTNQHEFGWSSANITFLQEIQSWIAKQLNVSKVGYIIDRHTKNGSVCQFVIGGNQNFQKLYHLFYDDAVESLKRKHKLALQFHLNILNHIDGRTTRHIRSNDSFPETA